MSNEDDPPPGELDRTGEVTIYDVARVAGVAPSTVSRALSKPGRVSFKTAEHVREVARQVGYRPGTMERAASSQRAFLLGMVVADIGNPVFSGMIRGAGRTAAEAGHTLLVAETEESKTTEDTVLTRLMPAVDGVILTSSRLPDAAIRAAAKHRPLVVLNRVVTQVPSVASDNVHAMKKITEHLVEHGVRAITYLAGPEASWADGMRWRGLREAGLELDLKVRRIGPLPPTFRGGAQAAEEWLHHPTPGVIAYNDLVAIGFLRAVVAAGRRVPDDVNVVGFDNIVDAALVEPGLTTVAAPLVSLGSTAVHHLLRSSRRQLADPDETVYLPARLVIRDSTGPLGRP